MVTTLAIYNIIVGTIRLHRLESWTHYQSQNESSGRAPVLDLMEYPFNAITHYKWLSTNKKKRQYKKCNETLKM